MTTDALLYEAAARYISWDPNEETKAQMTSFVETRNVVELRAALNSRLAFGTAGLRGAMGPGYNKMNDLVILQTTQGIAKYLIDQLGPDAKKKGVVIGYDHRKLGSLTSSKFTRLCSAILLSMGFKVYLLLGYVPTPFVAFAVPYLDCAAGFMITASHNPKADNGFKIYWGNGAQIVPPHDTDWIAAFIMSIRTTYKQSGGFQLQLEPNKFDTIGSIAKAIMENLAPWQPHYDVSAILQHENAEDVTKKITAEYYRAMCSLANDRDFNAKSPLRVTYTAMHGVGSQWVKMAFFVFGHPPFIPVLSQIEPDPEFPTVTFPNPEENGALNEAMLTASSKGINLIIANDPDADRFAAAESIKNSDEGSTSNKWHIFTGNEIGVLLGYWQIQKWKKSLATCTAATKVSPTQQVGTGYEKRVAVLASVVSSRMLRAIAVAEGVEYYDTLTGFKWIGNKALSLKAVKVSVLFSYEEALGYCVGDIIADKDGITAAAVFVQMAAELLEKGVSVHSHLQSLLLKYGEFISYNSYVISNDPVITNKIFERLRKEGPSGGYWTECGGVKITSIKDITLGYDSTTNDNKSDLPITPDSHMIMMEFENGCSVTLRTSGTEPKIKYYTEIAGDPLNPKSRYELEKKLKIFVHVMVTTMLQPECNCLLYAT